MSNCYNLNDFGGLAKLARFEKAKRLKMGAKMMRDYASMYSREYDFVQEAYKNANKLDERAKILEGKE